MVSVGKTGLSPRQSRQLAWGPTASSWLLVNCFVLIQMKMCSCINKTQDQCDKGFEEGRGLVLVWCSYASYFYNNDYYTASQGHQEVYRVWIDVVRRDGGSPPSDGEEGHLTMGGMKSLRYFLSLLLAQLFCCVSVPVCSHGLIIPDSGRLCHWNNKARGCNVSGRATTDGTRRFKHAGLVDFKYKRLILKAEH